MKVGDLVKGKSDFSQIHRIAEVNGYYVRLDGDTIWQSTEYFDVVDPWEQPETSDVPF